MKLPNKIQSQIKAFARLLTSEKVLLQVSDETLGFGEDDGRLSKYIPKVFPESPTRLRSDTEDGGKQLQNALVTAQYDFGSGCTASPHSTLRTFSGVIL